MKKSDVKDVTIRAMDSALTQPAMGTTPEADSVQTSPVGRAVSFPDAADMKSAGGVKSTTSLVEKTGSKVSFPDAADMKSAGGVKEVSDFTC